jgi:hypothetical protein
MTGLLRPAGRNVHQKLRGPLVFPAALVIQAMEIVYPTILIQQICRSFAVSTT